MAICKLCHEEKKLIKAHLLPNSILKRIGDEKQRHVSAELTNLDNHSVKQDDYWDKSILCHACDNTFSPIEQYFLSFITDRVNNPDQKFKVDDGEVLRYNNIDEIKLRLFPLITLWRMSISKTENSQGVQLGSLEAMVYKCVKKMDPGPYDFFPFVIYSLKNVNDGRATFIGNPLPLKIDGFHYYVIPISDFIVLIRAGKNVSENLVKSSVKDNSIELISLNDRAGKALLDSIFYTIKSIPRHKP